MFEPSESGYHVRGTIANLRNEETTVPDLVFEFLDIDGRVVTTETVFGQTLISKATDRFQLGPVGEGIAAWRYKAES